MSAVNERTPRAPARPALFPLAFWGGIALLAGWSMFSYSPRLTRDILPAAAFLALAAGIVFRLRTGPILVLGLWAAAELRPRFAPPDGMTWTWPAGSTDLLVAAALVFVFASCQYQFLGAGAHPRRKEAFTATLPGASRMSAVLATAVAVALRALLVAGILWALGGAAEWMSVERVGGNFPPRILRIVAFFWAAALAFLGVRLAADVARFLTLDRTAAACFVNDAVWHAHRGMWARIERRRVHDRY